MRQRIIQILLLTLLFEVGVPPVNSILDSDDSLAGPAKHNSIAFLIQADNEETETKEDLINHKRITLIDFTKRNVVLNAYHQPRITPTIFVMHIGHPVPLFTFNLVMRI